MALERRTSPSKQPASSDAAHGLGSVLVAVDWSPGGRSALQRAAGLPYSIGGRVELTHVGRASDNEAEIHARLDEERERLRDALGATTVLTSVLHGDIAESLVQRARHAHAQLIVLGRHGTQTWRDTVLGTTADRVVRGGSTSTLVVAGPASGAYRRPLVAVDFSASSRLAVELAVRVSRAEGGLCALHVTSPGIQEVAEVRRQLESFVVGIASSDRCRYVVQVGEPGLWILESARQRNSDLIVVGAAGKSIVRRALMGSISQRVMRDATCDVLVARLPEVNG